MVNDVLGKPVLGAGYYPDYQIRLFRRDKLLIVLAVLMPLIFMSLAGLTSSLRLRNVKLLVYDYDNTALSRTYLETYGAAITFIITAHLTDESPERALASGRGRAALIIPQNFERDARRGAEPIVQLMIDATDSNAATALEWAIPPALAVLTAVLLLAVEHGRARIGGADNRCRSVGCRLRRGSRTAGRRRCPSGHRARRGRRSSPRSESGRRRRRGRG